MQIRSLRFPALFAVVVIAVCVITSLTKDRTSAIVVKTSRIINDSVLTKTPYHPTKTITAKTPRTATKYSIKRMQEGSIDTVWFDDALPAGAVPNVDNTQSEQAVSFKNINGYYFTAMNGGGWEINVYKKTIAAPEKFKLVDLNGGTLESGDSIRLVASDGVHYVSAHDGGAARWTELPAGRVFANKTTPGAWETFVIRKGDGTTGTIGTGVKVSLQSSDGFYFWSDEWYQDEPIYAPPFGQLFANSTTVGAYETFTLNTYGANDEGNPIISLKSSGGYYVSSKNGTGYEVNVDIQEDNYAAFALGSYETFALEDVNGGQLESGDRVRLRRDYGSWDGRYYLSIYEGGVAKGTPPPYGRAYVNTQTASTNETFTIRKVDGSSGAISDGANISIQTENGYYFCAEGGGSAEGATPPLGQLFANDTYIGGDGDDVFTIEMTTSGGGGSDESWNWVSSNPAPYSGTKAHQSSIATGIRQHYFTGASATLPVGIGDHLYTWVYLDPANMPSEIMLQWNDGVSWDHRAYWGANSINLGTDGTISRKYMGGLSAAGSWVKLDIPASAVGLEGKTVSGMAFTQYGGRVTWDKAGKTKTVERVIVKLNVPYTLETQLPSDAERQAQRNRIIQAQDALLSSITDYYPDSVKRFDLAPYLGLVVGSTGLQMLQTSQYVSSITEDKLMAPATGENLTIVGAPLAWNQNVTGAGQTIVVLDTGVDKTHPALLNKVKAEACFSAYDENAEEFGLTSLCPGGGKFSDLDGSGVNCPMEKCEHGTQVAGAAVGNNDTDNYYGVAKDANIISIQIFSKLDNNDVCAPGQSPCAFSHQTDQMRALEYVYHQKTDPAGKYKNYNIAAVNVSVTGNEINSGECNTNTSLEFIDSLRGIGIPVIAPSGNDSKPDAISEPACMPKTISVGATGGTADTANSILPLSNSISFLKLLAPGGSIYAPIPGTGYNTTSGTSLAAAHVSGAWAVLKQQDPNASVDKILNKLRDNGVWITDQRNNRPFPRIDIAAALSCLQNVDNSTAWKGEYFDNSELTGDPVMIRKDSSVGQFLDKNLGDGSLTSPCGPGTSGSDNNNDGINDGISVRWTRTIGQLTPNNYGFFVTADKDVRFYVDGIEKTNGWETINGTKMFPLNISSTRSPVLKLEYKTSQAVATNVKLSWSVPPIAPSNLAASAQSISQINLNWTSNSNSSPNGFWLERSTDGGNTFPWSKDVGNVVNYADSGLSPATTYAYRVRAYNNVGNSGYSNTSSVVTLPDAPSNLTASAVSPSQINLSWSNNSGFIHSYRIYRNGGKIAEVGPRQTSYADSGLTPVTTYTYQVTAYNTSGESSHSNQSSVMTWRPIPAAPVNLAASAASTSQIDLSWNNNSSYTDGFRIYRNGGRIADVGAGQTSYADSGLALSTTYTYQVTAYNTTGESGYSNQSSATTSSCTYYVDSPSIVYIGSSSQSIPVSVSTSNICEWSVIVKDDTWISPTPEYGVGNNTVILNVDSNGGYSPRSITVDIAGTELKICQDGIEGGGENACSSFFNIESKKNVSANKNNTRSVKAQGR